EFARKSEAAERRLAMVKLAKYETGIPVLPIELDADPWLLNVMNGTLNLRTGALCPHRRADLITTLAPVAFDPSAHAPRWETFLREVTANCEPIETFL